MQVSPSIDVSGRGMYVNDCSLEVLPFKPASVMGRYCWTTPFQRQLTQPMSLTCFCLIRCSPPQTCRRFKEKILRQCHSMRQLDCNLCPLDLGKKSFSSVSFSRADLRLRKTSSTVPECHSLAPTALGKTSVIVTECRGIRKQFRTQMS